jgi:thiamine-phosphate pyrophosphorylase
VGFAETLAEIAPLAAAGADFVAVGDAVWDDPRGAVAALTEASRLLAPEPV